MEKTWVRHSNRHSSLLTLSLFYLFLLSSFFSLLPSLDTTDCRSNSSLCHVLFVALCKTVRVHELAVNLNEFNAAITVFVKMVYN